MAKDIPQGRRKLTPVFEVTRRDRLQFSHQPSKLRECIIEAVEDKPWNLRVFYDFNWEVSDYRRRAADSGG